MIVGEFVEGMDVSSSFRQHRGEALSRRGFPGTDHALNQNESLHAHVRLLLLI